MSRIAFDRDGFGRADFVFSRKNAPKRKYVRDASEFLVIVKDFAPMHVCASIELTFVPIQARTVAFLRVASLEFDLVPMSSQSASTRLPRKASTHSQGYYSQVAAVDDDDVAERDAKRRRRRLGRQIEAPSQVRSDASRLGKQSL